jgi:tungstate transport system ATP-binding protein
MKTLSIEIKELSKVYNGQPVLRGCSLTFDRGLIHALIGPNGSGKTTLLRLCNLLDSPLEGKVLFKSSDVQLEASIELRRRMAMVFHRPSLFNTTVWKNILYGLKVRGINRKESERKGKKALEMVGLWKLKDRNALTLSVGESQRVALARAMVIDPEVLFLDEPTSNLDPGSVVIIEEIIKDMKKSGTTIILVTQNIFQVKSV